MERLLGSGVWVPSETTKPFLPCRCQWQSQGCAHPRVTVPAGGRAVFPSRARGPAQSWHLKPRGVPWGISPGHRRSVGSCPRSGRCGTAGTAPKHLRPPPARSQPIQRCQGLGCHWSPSGTPQDPLSPTLCPHLTKPCGSRGAQGAGWEPAPPGGNFVTSLALSPPARGCSGVPAPLRGLWHWFAPSPRSWGGATSLQEGPPPSARCGHEGTSLPQPGKLPLLHQPGDSPTSPRAPGDPQTLQLPSTLLSSLWGRDELVLHGAALPARRPLGADVAQVLSAPERTLPG